MYLYQNTPDGYKTQPGIKKLKGTFGLYVDDTLGSGNSDLKVPKLENRISDKFESKPREYPPFVFADITTNEKGSG